MNYNKRSVTDVDLSGKKVLLRCDFNVPLDPETGRITSDTRIRATLPTIEYILEQDKGTAICTNLCQIAPGGYFEGDITTADLITVKGSVINGKIIIAK
ncbi:MAG: phosphoglycerate kinase [Oscillospiraceae bacterium]|nr:phosphoglycerate kinase [Oscillospiraceae bacterium]